MSTTSETRTDQPTTTGAAHASTTSLTSAGGLTSAASPTSDSAATGAPASGQLVGIWVALLAAASFGSSGSFAKPLLEAGWSPGAAVTARIGGAALVLAVPTALGMRGRWHVLRGHAGLIVTYGVVAMAACQLFYFNAVTRLDVGVALLLEYLAPVLLIGWLWLRTGVRPSRMTLAGAVVSIVGLVLVLDLTGAVAVDLVGVAWGLGAATCLVVYFVLSAKETDGLPPLALAGAAMVVATAALLVVGLVGAMPFEATTDDVAFVGGTAPFFVPLVGLVVISTAVPYVAGIASTRRLGSRLASFVGLTEVLFAVLIAWMMLGELPVLVQLAGGVLILVGVGLVRYAESEAPLGEPMPEEPTLPAPEGMAEAAPSPTQPAALPT